MDGLWSNYSVCRANDVANANALVACTTSVPPASSACSGIETVPSARQSGMAINGLVRKRSPRQRNIFEARGEVVVAEEDSKRLRKRRMRLTKAEKTTCASGTDQDHYLYVQAQEPLSMPLLQRPQFSGGWEVQRWLPCTPQARQPAMRSSFAVTCGEKLPDPNFDDESIFDVARLPKRGQEVLFCVDTQV